MDAIIVIAALILNPIARRKRAMGSVQSVQVAEASAAAISGSRDSISPEKSDLESGDRPRVVDKSINIWLKFVAFTIPNAWRSDGPPPPILGVGFDTQPPPFVHGLDCGQTSSPSK